MAHPEYERLFCDTSYFYALLDSRDEFHSQALGLSKEIEEYQIPLFASWEVVQETITLLRYRHSYEGCRIFIDQLLPNINVIVMTNEERQQAIDRFKERATEKELSLCDVLSRVLVKNRLGNPPCLTFDDDFEAMGLTVVRTL
ncbi:MAG: type II toxin-antitoxin system VapC family toxin [bacterium]